MIGPKITCPDPKPPYQISIVLPAKAGIHGGVRKRVRPTRTTPNRQASFSYLGAPGATGTDDSHENRPPGRPHSPSSYRASFVFPDPNPESMVPALPRLTGEKTACPVLETGSPRATMRGRYPWWGDSVGGTPLHRPARSRSDPHQVPTMGTASGCGTTVWWYRPGIQVAPSLRLTGERTACPVLETGSPSTPMRDRHPWSLPSLVLPVKKRHPAPRCGAGTHGGVTAWGARPYIDRPVAEAIPTRSPPWVPHRGAARRCGGTGPEFKWPPPFVLPKKEQPAPCLKRGHSAPRCGTGIHGPCPPSSYRGPRYPWCGGQRGGHALTSTGP